MKKNLVVLCLLTIIFFGCKSDSEKFNFVQSVETAHNKNDFTTKEAIQFDLNLKFGGKERLNATLTVSTNSQFALIEMKNGEKIFVNNDKVYCSPNLSDNKSVRFDAYTWSYFFMFPYKLSDEGTQWSNYIATQSESNFDTKKLSFESNIGDSSDDWYIVYSHKETHLIEHVAYIVTSGKTLEKAEEDPHAIQYLNYSDVDGIPFSQKWIFWEWRKDKGLTKDLGIGELSNIRFVKNSLAEFQIPENFVEK